MTVQFQIERGQYGANLLLAAWCLALIATFGALFTGEVMGQTPCNLCWFQRAFMFPLSIILAVACLTGDLAVWRYALPIAAVGWLLALYHTLLYAGIIPPALEPCSQGVPCAGANMRLFGWMPIPVLALASFTAIAALLNLIRKREHS